MSWDNLTGSALSAVAALSLICHPITVEAGPTSYVCELSGFQIVSGQLDETLQWVGENALRTSLAIDRITGRVIHPSVGSTGFKDVTVLNPGSSDWSFKAVASSVDGGWVRYYEVKEYEEGLTKGFVLVADGHAYWGTCL